jgi:hypothetical protein
VQQTLLGEAEENLGTERLIRKGAVESVAQNHPYPKNTEGQYLDQGHEEDA